MRRYVKYALIAAAILPFAAGFLAWRVSQPIKFGTQVAGLDGLGSVKIGMTLQEMKAMTRRDFKLEYFYDEDETDPAAGEASSCYYALPLATDVDIRFLMSYGKLARIDIESDAVAVRGLKIGSSEKEVLAIFPGALKEPHQYIPDTGFYLTVVPDGLNGLLFETDESRVIAYRIGHLPQLAYVEGCL